MDQILTHCNGVIGNADDVVVYGKDDKEHDKCLHKFIRVTHVHGLVFNKVKCAVKQTSAVFFVCVYDANGDHPDPEKVSEVHNMLVTETATQLQKFLWLVNLPVTLHTLSLLLYCTPTWAAERNRVHLEQQLSGSIWQGQINGLQGYHTAVLLCPQACH